MEITCFYINLVLYATRENNYKNYHETTDIYTKSRTKTKFNINYLFVSLLNTKLI